MSWRSIKRHLRDFWIYYSIWPVSMALVFVELTGTTLDNWLALGGVVALGGLSIYDGIQDSRERSRDRKEIKDLHSTVKSRNKKVDELTVELTGHRQEFLDWKEGKETSLRLVRTLVEKGAIKQEEVYKHLDEKNIFLIYAFANPPPKLGDEALLGPRKYPAWLKDELGAVRMGKVSHLFATNGQRLPDGLQTEDTLTRYLESKLVEPLDEEWTEILKKLKRKRRPEAKKFLKRLEEKGRDDFLKMEIVAIRTKIGASNLGVISSPVLPKDFREMLDEVVDLRSVELSGDSKVKARKFLTDSSFDFLLFDFPQADIDALVSEESRLKAEHSVKSLFDYLRVSEKNLADSIATIDGVTDAAAIANKMKLRIGELRQAAQDLAIPLT